MQTPKVYVICDQNCLYEGMTKEQILAAITQAVNEGTIGDCDTGFIQTIKTINGLPLRFFVGDQATYNALSDEQKENLYAIITNDTTQDGINAAIEELQTNVRENTNTLGVTTKTVAQHDQDIKQLKQDVTNMFGRELINRTNRPLTVKGIYIVELLYTAAANGKAYLGTGIVRYDGITQHSCALNLTTSIDVNTDGTIDVWDRSSGSFVEKDMTNHEIYTQLIGV